MEWAFSNGIRNLSIITQNVDGLHYKAAAIINDNANINVNDNDNDNANSSIVNGSTRSKTTKTHNSKSHVTELHGRNDVIKCMNCGSYHCRHEYHETLANINSNWIDQVNEWNRDDSDNDNRNGNDGTKNDDKNDNQKSKKDGKDKDKVEVELRPDGDAYIAREQYGNIQIPSCNKCNIGFYKPDVVFFGDSVPKHRVDKCYGAVDASDGILCIGSSLAVLSAYRFVQHAEKKGIPIAILNVGETRAEVNGMDVLKIEAPASQTLMALVDRLSSDGKE
jgi:NAD-dependent deacetylase sirtuin 4